MRVAPLLLAVALALSPVGIRALALDDGIASNPAIEGMGDEEAATNAEREMQEEAAGYRLGRVRNQPNAWDDERGLAYLREARWLMDTPGFLHRRRATWKARRGFDKHPYAACAGELLRTALRSNIKRGNIGGVNEDLLKIWYFLPDYPDMTNTMTEALASGEQEQDFTARINLEANDPYEVIRIGGDTVFEETNRLFVFLARHGDRGDIAPRAALGLARARLIDGGKEEIFLARDAYERFLEDYPNHGLTFTALCEHALSFLVAYNGDNYDAGALVYAAAIIDQAEIEARGDTEKLRVIAAYRKRIRSWQQDRDLAIARWYRNREHPWLLTWLRTPSGLEEPVAGARLYYQQTIRRDPTSDQGRTAERELADLPPVPANLLPLTP